MKIITTVISSVVSIIVLFLLTKLMGNKQISQITLFDYIIGISIGSIAAEMATELENPLMPLLAMIIYGIIAFSISVLADRSLGLRKIIYGRPIIIMDNGNIYRRNMKKARLDLSDFLTLCRAKGYFDLSQIQTAILEHNGTLSILPKEEYRSSTPKDLDLDPTQETLIANIILDGHILEGNLRFCPGDKKWLLGQLKTAGFNSEKDIFLATCDQNGKLSFYPQKNDPLTEDRFE